MSDSVWPHRRQPTRLLIPGILQARILEWVSISFPNAWNWKVKVKSLSRARLLATPWTAAYQAPPSMGFSRQEYWSGMPLPSPSHPSRLSQSIGFEFPVLANSKFPAAICFTYGNACLPSQIIPPSPSLTVSKHVFYICISTASLKIDSLLSSVLLCKDFKITYISQKV